MLPATIHSTLPSPSTVGCALAQLVTLPDTAPMTSRPFPRIRAVHAYSVHAKKAGEQGSDCHDVPTAHWINGTGDHPVRPATVI